MKDERKVPAIRFKGFSDAWEQRKLGEFGSVAMNKRIFKAQTTESGDIPFYKIGTFGGTPDAYISRKLYVEYKNKYPYPKKGDILISASGSIGRTVVYAGEEAYYQDSNIVWLNHDSRLDNSFLLHVYAIVKWAGIEGSTISRLYNENILSTSIKLPKIEEQRKIGDLLSKIDTLITLHQRKLDKLKNIKKALLEKMFPADGALTPRLRFKSFDDAWEQRKLGEIGKTYTGLSGKTKEDFGHGDACFVTYLNIFSNPVADIEGVEPVEIDSKQNEVLYGDVFFTTSSETPDEVGMSSIWLGSNCNTYLNSFCFGYRLDIEVDKFYLAYALRSPSMRKKIVVLAQGISRYNISKNKMMEVDLNLPSLDEQKKIGASLYGLDSLITLHQRKLDKLKNMKKALLDKMLV